jgi:hypothetical protein
MDGVRSFPEFGTSSGACPDVQKSSPHVQIPGGGVGLASVARVWRSPDRAVRQAPRGPLDVAS